MLNSLLAGFDFGKYGTPIIIGAAVVVGIIALIVGLVKGFSRLGWGALIWGAACGAFYLLDTKLHAKNPLMNAVKNTGLDTGAVDLIVSASYAAVCILGALLLFGILGAIFKRKRSGFTLYYGNDNDEWEDAQGDEYDDEEGVRPSRRSRGGNVRRVSDKYRPCVFNRIVGGLIAVVNAELVLFALLAFASVILRMTPLGNGNGVLADMYRMDWVHASWKYILGYTVDFLIIAIIAAVGYSGYRAGMLYGFRSIFLVGGIIASLVFGFWIPFNKAWIAEGKTLAFVGDMSGFFGGKIENLFGEPNDFQRNLSVTLGKVSAGAIVAAVFCIAVVIVGFFLKLLAQASRHNIVVRTFDGCLSAIVMVAVGIVICALIMALLYLLEYYGVVTFRGKLFDDEFSTLAKGSFDVLEKYLKPLLDGMKG